MLVKPRESVPKLCSETKAESFPKDNRIQAVILTSADLRATINPQIGWIKTPTSGGWSKCPTLRASCIIQSKFLLGTSPSPEKLRPSTVTPEATAICNRMTSLIDCKGRPNYENDSIRPGPVTSKKTALSISKETLTFSTTLFEYLRRGTFPLDFNTTRGHNNYGLYARLRHEAKYFQGPHLFTFLEDQCFQKCVTWEITNEIYDCQTMGSSPHRGKPELCGRQCKNVLAYNGHGNDIHTISEYVIVKRKLKFNLEWMSDDGCHRQEFINHLQEKKAYDESGSSCAASGSEGNLELDVNATPLNHHPGERPILNIQVTKT
ncbi:hypothetical protein PAAG_05854 [Paracoccidioides lutzii Pb01]|uniref:Uncharacterized protein n=1 Tax=Paracoccidioides lutzii (strain ATCC MYA-826 / Pb01) TaxID=502779 RepID=C1H513_PARBA|nr:hypothetical protein PAAG_05854 [Paracoccidioides lutzii Pb01]EEH34807.2 hypothetical protein PAAG_05854 [Paracoccidioides lutzii Pb01]